MNVWLCIPSARPPEEAVPTLNLWREKGYKLAVWRDQVDRVLTIADHWIAAHYPGYAKAVNELVAQVLRIDPDAQWIVTGGDDTEPDPQFSATQIGEQLSMYFWALHCGRSIDNPPPRRMETFGVCQPTGDDFAGRQIERICGSPWMGRDFCERANGGHGPLWPEYVHMFVDEELQNVAIRLACFAQRRDLTHRHNHFTRRGSDADWAKPIPEFLREANSPEHWQKYKAIFETRRAAGFPGHEPLAGFD